jgi:hypothetical protein
MDNGPVNESACVELKFQVNQWTQGSWVASAGVTIGVGLYCKAMIILLGSCIRDLSFVLDYLV